MTGDIPSDLSSEDTPSPSPPSNALAQGSEGMGSALVVEVLRELDKDYMALRSRLVSLIEQQSQPLNPSASPSASHGEVEAVGSDSAVAVDHVPGVVDEAEAEHTSVPPTDGTDSSDGSGDSTAPTRLESKPARFKYWPSRQLVTV